MTPRYRLTQRAIDDLVDTWEYVNGKFGVRVADRVLDDLEAAFEVLADHPEIGQVRSELASPPWRLWPVGPSLIAYRSDVRPIWIARIARAAVDWTQLELEKPPQ